MSLFQLLDIANNGLKTQRELMQYSTENVSNMFTPGYKAKHAVVAAKAQDASFSQMLAAMGSDGDNEFAAMILGEAEANGTQVAAVETDMRPGAMVYMPDHPLADANGNVEMSNVDSAGEMMHMMEAVKQYKANLTIAEMAKKAAQEALNMTKNG